ncbi:hypothetical protein RCL10_03740 [Staphylococcus lloydii]|uniref:hypothetical protein n=1 Tax=Staphylococcus lloydii TaxID=2781774 RepID=UPI0029294FB8|nr:hypothetical protein [Staphylococcus lloydii]MDU9417636.1 hypothetical protein [Staphylococcus lloydii]
MKNIGFVIFVITVMFVIAGCGSNSQSTKEQQTKTVSIKNTYEFKDKNKDHNSGTMKSEVLLQS